MEKRIVFIFVFISFCLLGSQLFSQTRDRSEIDEKYKWDLTDLYPSDEAYQKAKEATVAKFDGILEFKGRWRLRLRMLPAGIV